MTDLKPLTTDQTRALADAQAVKRVQVIATPEGLRVEFNEAFYLANRQREVRYFQRSDTLLNWLRELGIEQIEVNLREWNK